MKIGPANFKRIVVLTGAGISAESGLNTFRDADGHWENHRIEEVATLDAFEKNPQLVWKFYSMRRIEAGKASPNAAHKALVEFANQLPLDYSVHLVTQNVDGLHERANTIHKLNPISMHGSLNQSRCSDCGNIYFDDHAYFDLEGNYAPQETGLCDLGQKASTDYLHQYKLEYQNFLPLSPCCKKLIRPHIVWFGEMPLYMEMISEVLKKVDLFVTIGTSGLVYPAGSFLEMAKRNGATTVCINKEAIPQNEFIDGFMKGNAVELVPQFFNLKY